jgi:hypothetical protein
VRIVGRQLIGNGVGNGNWSACLRILIPDIDSNVACAHNRCKVKDLVAVHQLVYAVRDADPALSGVRQNVVLKSGGPFSAWLRFLRLAPFLVRCCQRLAPFRFALSAARAVSVSVVSGLRRLGSLF